jgi:DNA-binding MurR/RpiR family transcriptional regulator
LPVVDLIAEQYAGLSPGHRRLADFILTSPHEAALMTQEQISTAVGVSAATANRLGAKLGLAGYPELQNLLKVELKEALRPVEDFSRTMTVDGLALTAPWTQSMQQDMERIRSVRAIGGDSAFARAASRLADAGRVFFLGFGSSAFIAQYGAFCLSTIRGNCEALADSSGFEGADRKLLDSGPKDAAVVVGFARYSAPALKIARQLHELGVKVICITDGENSPFVPYCETCFIVKRKTGFVLTGSGAGAVSVIEALMRGAAMSLGQDEVSRRAARLTSMLGDAVLPPDEKDDPA